MRGDEDAIAPLVAMLLILAAVVTLLSVYNSSYMPQLKEKAEITHLEEVSSSFKNYVTYIENSAREKKEGTISIPVKLGGGDVFLSPGKSGGALYVGDCTTVISVQNENNTMMNGTVCSLDFGTVGNFWHERGYSWNYGIVNITEFSKSTPLSFAGMDDASDYIENVSGFPGSLVDISFRGGYVPRFDAYGNFTGTSYNCTAVYVDIVRLKGDPGNNYVSGNGDAVISVDTSTSPVVNMTGSRLNFTITDINGEGGFMKRALLKNIESDLCRLKSESFENIFGTGCGDGWCSIECREDVPFLVKFVDITVGLR